MSLDERELKEILQSSNINFLIGAGCSYPYLSLLGDIEQAMVDAKDNQNKVLKQLKTYFNDVMYPCLSILDDGKTLSTVKPSKNKPSDKEKFDITKNGYKEIFESINNILLHRKITLLNKQVNVFTTNIDIFMEKILEDMNFEYNDGFSGNINPTFQTSNFNKSMYKISTHFSNVSEIPTFNIIKLHGSLSWGVNKAKDKIVFSKLKSLSTIESSKSNNNKFQDEYNKLQIVNPTKNKFQETVMDVTYYELLRIYSSALEKENTVLFVIGFSMDDEHIRTITKRVADSNPTLKIYIFCHAKGRTSEKCTEWFKDSRYQNIAIITPETEDKTYDLSTINSDYFVNIVSDKKPEIAEEDSENEAEIIT